MLQVNLQRNHRAALSVHLLEGLLDQRQRLSAEVATGSKGLERRGGEEKSFGEAAVIMVIIPNGSMYAIYGDMDPINIPQILAYIPYMDPIIIMIIITPQKKYQ